MSYLNSVTIIGFVGADPEQRQARNNNGSKFTVLSVATQRSWKNTDVQLRPTSLIPLMSSSTSNAGLDADMFPKSSSSTDTIRMRTYSTTAPCSWLSRTSREH